MTLGRADLDLCAELSATCCTHSVWGDEEEKIRIANHTNAPLSLGSENNWKVCVALALPVLLAQLSRSLTARSSLLCRALRLLGDARSPLVIVNVC